MINKLLTSEDVAAMINCGPSTIYEWAKSGKIPSLKLNGLVRFVPEEVQQWIQKNRQTVSDTGQSLSHLTHQRVTGVNVNSIIRKTIDAEKKRNYNISSKGKARPNQAQKGVE
ncbi:MAG TPA: helix-turn-helix domain-containing protein [Nitrospirota bacterium]|nr:helix-turn-helix domain-containing protein [Nitrospirota bacterium]